MNKAVRRVIERRIGGFDRQSSMRIRSGRDMIVLKYSWYCLLGVRAAIDSH